MLAAVEYDPSLHWPVDPAGAGPLATAGALTAGFAAFVAGTAAGAAAVPAGIAAEALLFAPDVAEVAENQLCTP